MNKPVALSARVFRLALVTAVALIGVSAATAQQIRPVGSETALEIATWNIEWFGASNGPSDDELQLANAATIIGESEIDLWAVQEIADTGYFNRLLDLLGDPWQGLLSSSSNQQRMGFVYNGDFIRLNGSQSILTSYNWAFAGRPPLQIDTDVTLPDTTVRVVFIVLHMKAFSDLDSYRKRAEAARRLKTHLEDSTVPGAYLAEVRFAVLGDFNDELERSITSGQSSPYAAFLADSDNYFFATLDMERTGRSTWCGSSRTCTTGSTIDHIMVSEELEESYVAGSADRHQALLADINDFTETTSDHLPVFARFRFEPISSVAVEPNVPVDSPGLEVFPVPAGSVLHVRSPRRDDRPSRIDVVDLLGRVVRSVPGSNADLDVQGLPRGFYVIIERESGLRRIAVLR